jgi:phosphatidylglycerophosphate synthase
VAVEATTAGRRGTWWRSPAPACGHHGCWDGWAEPLATWPNLVTALRTIAALLLSAAAVSTGRQDLLLAALAVYWAGDVADGALARRLGQETRGGALFDVLADRACSVAFWLPWVLWHPESVWPVMLYLFEFAVVDGLLSVAWLAWPLLSCNYVERVHGQVYRLNWWPPAKAVNTAGLVLLVVVWPQPLLAVLFVAAVLAVKVASLVRLHAALPAPGPGCAARTPRSPSRLPS